MSELRAGECRWYNRLDERSTGSHREAQRVRKANDMSAAIDKNTEWFVQADLSPYEGEYVAIARQQVVAHGREPGQVYEEGKKRFPDEKVILWKVMRHGYYVFGERRIRGD
jgi:hypothetical protein